MTQYRRDVPAALATLLDSNKRLNVCDLITLTLSGGSVFRWTSHDQVVSIGGTSWTLGPGIATGRMKWTAGVEVDTLSLSLYARQGSTLINGVGLMPFINGGGLDGATVVVERAFRAAAGDAWVGKLHRFSGTVSDVDRPSRVEATITLRSEFEVLNQQLPRNVFEAQCDRTVYDTGCNVAKATYTVAGAVSAVGALRLSFGGTNLSTKPDGYYTLGAVVFTSGVNAGVRRTIRASTAAGVITLVQPLPLAPSVGDTFSIYPGCDRSLATCTNKFANARRFRGTPYIPAADTVI